MDLTAQAFTLDTTGPKPLYVQIETGIEAMIRDQGLRAGDPIPSPNVFAKVLSVNELTVRRAFRRLIGRHVLVSRQGRGTFVSEVGAQTRVLWVCGSDPGDGDVSPYFTDACRLTKAACAELGLTLESAWLSNARPQQAQRLCEGDALSAYQGFIFVGCNTSTHPVYAYVRDRDLPFVLMSGEAHLAGQPRQITGNLQGAVTLGLEHLAQRGHTDNLSLFSITGYTAMLRRAIIASGLNVQLVELPECQRLSEVESGGYRVMHEMLRGGRVDSGLLILDDIIARGVTRALLEHAAPGPKPDIVVRCGREQLIPFGMPVTYVVSDSEAEAREAGRILNSQIKGDLDTAPDWYISQYELLPHSPAACVAPQGTRYWSPADKTQGGSAQQEIVSH